MITESPTINKDYTDNQSRPGTTLIKQLSNDLIYCQSSQNSASPLLITEDDYQGEEPEIINVGDSNIFEDYAVETNN